MKFIKLTDRFNKLVVVNMEQVQYMYLVKEEYKTFTALEFTDNTLYVKELLEQVQLKMKEGV